MKAAAAFFILSGLITADVFAKSTLRKVEQKVSQSKLEIDELHSSIGTLTKLRSDLEAEIRSQENEFRQSFTKVIIPLLSWPEVSLSSKLASWTDREHGRLLLTEMRERLVNEPLRLMADRELNLSTAIQAQAELESRVKALEAKQNLLNLQLEELKLLKKKSGR